MFKRSHCCTAQCLLTLISQPDARAQIHPSLLRLPILTLLRPLNVRQPWLLSTSNPLHPRPRRARSQTSPQRPRRDVLGPPSVTFEAFLSVLTPCPIPLPPSCRGVHPLRFDRLIPGQTRPSADPGTARLCVLFLRSSTPV